MKTYDTYWKYSKRYDTCGTCIDFNGLWLIYVDLYAFQCVYIHFLCVHQLGVAHKRAAGAFFTFLIMSICQNWSNYLYLWVWGSSKKKRAEESWILAVLKRPNLSWQADWWTKQSNCIWASHCFCIDVHWFLLIFIDFHVFSLIFMDVHYFLLLFIYFQGSWWIFVDLYGFPVIFMDFTSPGSLVLRRPVVACGWWAVATYVGLWLAVRRESWPY